MDACPHSTTSLQEGKPMQTGVHASTSLNQLHESILPKESVGEREHCARCLLPDTGTRCRGKDVLIPNAPEEFPHLLSLGATDWKQRKGDGSIVMMQLPKPSPQVNSQATANQAVGRGRAVWLDHGCSQLGKSSWECSRREMFSLSSSLLSRSISL